MFLTALMPRKKKKLSFSCLEVAEMWEYFMVFESASLKWKGCRFSEMFSALLGVTNLGI